MTRTLFWICIHCDLDLGVMTLGLDHDTPLGHGQRLCEILSRSNLAVWSYDLDTYFGYVCIVTLTFAILPCVKFMTYPWSWTTIVWNIIQVQHCSEELWPWHGFLVRVHCDIDIRDMTLAQVIDTILGHVKYYPDPTLQGGVMAQTQIFDICALWPCPLRYDLGSR